MVHFHALSELGKCYSSLDGNENQVTRNLEELGEQGWEMCGLAAENSSSHWCVFLKREVGSGP